MTCNILEGRGRHVQRTDGPGRGPFRRTAVAGLAVLCCLLGGSATAQSPKGPERWTEAIAAFEKQDARQPPVRNGVLFVGSSSIRMWDLEKYFPGKDYINRGFGGSQIADSIHFAEQLVLKHAPRCVVVYAGDNDVAAGKTPETVARDFRKLTGIIHERLPETRMVFIAIKPSLKRWHLYPQMKEANRRIAAQCAADPRLHFLDIATPMLGPDGTPRASLFIKDGLHLSHEGYVLWSRLLKPLLSESVSQASPQ